MNYGEQKIQTAIVVEPDVVARFWGRVDMSGGVDACWPWTGYVRTNGYGSVVLRGLGTRYAHRVSYEFSSGKAPGALNVCHHCDNRVCCNPAHLWLGTQQQNIRDAMAKGRHVPPRPHDWGAIMKQRHHHWQRLTAEQAAEIRARALSGERQEIIAADYNVNSRTVSKIKLGQRWAHI